MRASSLRVLPLLLLLAWPARANDGGTSADAGVRFDAPLYAMCPEAPPLVELDGGWKLLPPSRAERLACLLATCEADRRAKQDALEDSPPPWWWLGASAVVVTVAAAAFALGRATK